VTIVVGDGKSKMVGVIYTLVINVIMLQMTKPYNDIEVTDKYIIREFNENIDPIELMWHRDDESRTIEILEDTNWQLQLENCLPTSLKDRIFIPRHEWHRVIKGTGTLKLKIHKS